MVKLLSFSEEDYEYFAKGISIGVTIGLFVGILITNIILAFAVGGIAGILGAEFYSLYKKRVNKKNNIC